ncbi:MAG: MBL fold metallo-hydrolase [Chloroflexi bacterium]|nr:MBL fold metallo-hydrolase [Chloroflexota bacterium]
MVLRKVVVAPFVENTYIVGARSTGDGMVVDPGGEPERVLEAVADLGLTVKLIVNTHGHGDHTSAVAALKEATGATYALHQADVPLLKEGASWASRVVPSYKPPPEPDRLLADGDILEVGALRFQVLETPGHTPGGICLYGHGLVFTGDTLFQGSIGRFDRPGGNGRQLLLSIFSRLLTLAPGTIVLPGHGEQSTIGREKLTNPFLQRIPGLGGR